MNKLINVKNIYFLGIGGIGMSGLARWCSKAGFNVSGYDLVETKLTQQLESEGIEVLNQDSVATLSSEYLEKRETLVVFTPAIPNSSQLYQYFTKNDYRLIKRAVLLGEITENYFTIGVAGTHGKTTTSTMLAHLLKSSGDDCSAFLGGISTNYNTNVVISEDLTEDTRIVVEADEFDRSFLQLKPKMAIVTSVDPDHLDIYETGDLMIESFRQYVSSLPKNGRILLSEKIDLSVFQNELNGLNYSTYGFTESSDIIGKNVRVEDGAFVFDYVSDSHIIKGLKLYTPGFHNVENMLAAITLGLELGLSKNGIKNGINTFLGIKRRFEYIKKENNFVFINDYAHHPTEIVSFLTSITELYPDKEVLAIFQPHLYSRTRDFSKGFGESLSLARNVFLLDIYPAREEPIDGVDSSLIFDSLTSPSKNMGDQRALLKYLKNNPKPEVVLTIGAGDIVEMIDPILEVLN